MASDAHMAAGATSPAEPKIQPPPFRRQMSRTSSMKLRRAAWKMVRTQSSKATNSIDKVIRAWKIKNKVPRWMQQTQQDAEAMLAAARDNEKAESLRNFAMQQQPRQPIWGFFVKLSGQTEDDTPEEEMFESKWEEVEDMLTAKNEHYAQAHTDFGPMGELPMHICFLLCYSGKTRKLQNVMKRIAREVVQQYCMSGQWPTINEPYENDFHLWKRLGSELPNFRISEDAVGDDFGMYTGETILHIAIANQDRELVQWMLSKGATLHAEATGSFFLPKVIKVSEDDVRHAGDTERRTSSESAEHLPGEEQPEENLASPQRRAARLSITAWLFRALVAWVRGMDGDDARVTLRKNHFSAYASIASDATEKEQADDVHAAAMQDAGEAGLVSITKSMLYFGGMPLSFAVTVGDLEICKLLMDSAPSSERELILNKTDQYGGNTALHMAALHGRTEIFDWLVEQGKRAGKNSLSIMNKDGHTALTLAARMGNVELVKHILRQHFRTMVWAFGNVQLTQTSLEQVDTFKIQKAIAPGEANELVKESSISSWFSRHARRLSQRSHSGSFKLKGKRSRGVKEVEKEVWELHKERKFRSALQVIVDHEIEAFCEDEMFNKLLMQKWDKFGFHLYVLRTLVPYFIFLCFFTANVITRCKELRIQWAEAMSTGDLGLMRDSAESSVRGSTFLSGMVAFFGVLFFIDSWSVRRLRPEDLNPEQDGDLSLSKIMRAVYRNMSFGLSLAISAVVILAFAFQVTEQSYLELNMMAISCIFVFCYLLHTLVPFKTFGVLVIMIYRIFVKDVLYFLIIYAFLLCAFGIGLWMMFQKPRYPDELDYGQIRMDEYVGASLLSSVWVSLHEVDVADYIMASQYPGLSMSFHLVWILMSTVLLLNLLIGLMRQTFDSDKTKSASHRLWIFPFASLVLRHEKMLHTRWARYVCRFKHPARYRSGLMVNNHIDFIDDDDEIACQRFYEVKLEMMDPSPQAAPTTTAPAPEPPTAQAEPPAETGPHTEVGGEGPPLPAPAHANTAPPSDPAQLPQARAGSAGRQALPPPPSAREDEERDGRRAAAEEATDTMQGAAEGSWEGHEAAAGASGVAEARERLGKVQQRLEAAQRRLQRAAAVKERQPRLLHEVAARVRLCGAAIAQELRPLAAAVAECERQLLEVENEGEDFCDHLRSLDPLAAPHPPAPTL